IKTLKTPVLTLFLLAGAVAHPSLADQPNGKDGLAPVIHSVRSGSWSAASTWEGNRVPGQGDRVLIRPGHRVVYDVQSDQTLRATTVAGTLSFDPDRDTRLDVGLIAIQPGEEFTEEGFDCAAHVVVPDPSKPRPTLEVGTPDRPVAAARRALIRLVYVPGMDR